MTITSNHGVSTLEHSSEERTKRQQEEQLSSGLLLLLLPLLLLLGIHGDAKREGPADPPRTARSTSSHLKQWSQPTAPDGAAPAAPQASRLPASPPPLMTSALGKDLADLHEKTVEDLHRHPEQFDSVLGQSLEDRQHAHQLQHELLNPVLGENLEQHHKQLLLNSVPGENLGDLHEQSLVNPVLGQDLDDLEEKSLVNPVLGKP